MALISASLAQEMTNINSKKLSFHETVYISRTFSNEQYDRSPIPISPLTPKDAFDFMLYKFSLKKLTSTTANELAELRKSSVNSVVSVGSSDDSVLTSSPLISVSEECRSLK